MRHPPSRIEQQPRVYFPRPQRPVNETPEARDARHLRRLRQVLEGGAAALPEIAELLRGDQVIEGPPQGVAQ